MHVENLRKIEEKLAECVKCELDKGIEIVDTEELGAVIDMLKDIANAEYHSRICVAMEKAEEEQKLMEKLGIYGNESANDMRYYEDDRRYYDNYRYKSSGRFAPKGRGTYTPRRGYEDGYTVESEPIPIYTGRNRQAENMRDIDRNNGRMYYSETSNMNNVRDSREGRSGLSRRSYMETKELHKSNNPQDKEAKMKDLENYMKELTEDITSMISGASNEEKNLLKQKLTMLVQKI